MDTVVFALLVVALTTTLAVLFAGLFSMARGGDFNHRHGNRLMRWRVIAQGTALAFIALAALLAAGD
jgi:hypothetical protein